MSNVSPLKRSMLCYVVKLCEKMFIYHVFRNALSYTLCTIINMYNARMYELHCLTNLPHVRFVSYLWLDIFFYVGHMDQVSSTYMPNCMDHIYMCIII